MTPGALPAVVVPSGSKTGFSAASFSTVVSRRIASSLLELAGRDDLLREAAGVLGRGGARLRPGRPGVLGLAGDAELARDARGLHDHVVAVERRREAVEDHVVDAAHRSRAGSRSAPSGARYGAFDIDSIPPVTTTSC